MTALLGLLAISRMDGRAQEEAGSVVPGIKAIQEDEKTIRVIVPGQFETTFTKRKGFGGVWFDLKHEDKDLRAGLDLMRHWPDRTLPKGKDHIHLMMVFRHDLNGHEAAQPYANDNRSPDHLPVSKGKLDTTDDGDADADGFSKTESCYVLKSGRDSVAFALHGTAVARMFPAFKIKDWPDAPPETLTLGGEKLAAGRDFNASVRGGVLLLQIFRVIKDDVSVAIPGP